ncbi:S-layer homology domain-containing protein [Soehngenia longivitae]|nr:S-layer homology domain-containing protein [Soehngenia longivitae]
MKRAMSIVLSLLMVLTLVPNFSYAAEFSDMPDDWSKPALEKAVENGLLVGDNGKIRPKDNLKRAEMATVVNRAFGAYIKAPISKFADVSVTSWYYDEMAKAVQMQTFKGDGERLNPENFITREEAFIVLARALKLEPSATQPEGYKDLNDISSWAKGELYAMINAGYVNGSNGYINPKGLITRAEFAQVMDNIIKTYVKASSANLTFTGNVMVNTSGLVLKDSTVEGDLIIGEGVANGTVTLDNVAIEGRLIVRGGGVNSIIIKGNSTVGQVIVSRLDGAVRVAVESGAKVEVLYLADGKDEVILEGTLDKVVVDKNVELQLNNAQIKELNINAENALVKVDKTSKVDLLNISKEAENAKVEVMGTVTKLVTEAPKTAILGDGTVTEITVKPTADNTVISTEGGKVVVEEGAENVTVPETPPIGGGGVYIPPALTLNSGSVKLNESVEGITITGNNITVEVDPNTPITKIEATFSNAVEIKDLTLIKGEEETEIVKDKIAQNTEYKEKYEKYKPDYGTTLTVVPPSITFNNEILDDYKNNDGEIKVEITLVDNYGQTLTYNITLKATDQQDV